jgi:hypothetical protein
VVEGIERRKGVNRLAVRKDAPSDAHGIATQLDAIAIKLLDASACRRQRFDLGHLLATSASPDRRRLPADCAPCVGVSGDESKRTRAFGRDDQRRPRTLNRLGELCPMDRVVNPLRRDRLPPEQSIKKDKVLFQARYPLGGRPPGNPKDITIGGTIPNSNAELDPALGELIYRQCLGSDKGRVAGDDRGDERSYAEAGRSLRKRCQEGPCLKVKEALDAPGIRNPGMVETEFLRPPPFLLNCTEGSYGECENPEAPRHHDRSYNTFPAKAGEPGERCY